MATRIGPSGEARLIRFLAVAVVLAAGIPAHAQTETEQVTEAENLIGEARYSDAVALLETISTDRANIAVAVFRNLAIAYLEQVDLDRADEWLDRKPQLGYGNDTLVHRAVAAANAYDEARLAAGVDPGGNERLNALKETRADDLWNYARRNADARSCGITDDVLVLLETLETASCRAHGLRAYCRRDCTDKASCQEVVDSCEPFDACTLTGTALALKAALKPFCEQAQEIVDAQDPGHEYSKAGVTVFSGLTHAYSSGYFNAGLQVHVNIFKGLELQGGGGDAMRRSPLPSPPATWQFVHLPWIEASARYRADRFRVKPYGKLGLHWFFTQVYGEPLTETALEWETEFALLGGGGLDVMLDQPARHWYANVDLEVGGIFFSRFEDVPVLFTVRAGVGYRF